jgi:hypothetical protein
MYGPKQRILSCPYMLQERRIGATSMPPLGSLGQPPQQQEQLPDATTDPASPAEAAPTPGSSHSHRRGRHKKQPDGPEIPWPSDQAGRIWSLVHATWLQARASRWFSDPPSYLLGWARTKRRRVIPAQTNGVASGTAGGNKPNGGVPNGSAGGAGSDEESDSEDEEGGGVLPPSLGLPVPRLYSLDCEMCETTHETSALIALSVVDEQGKAVYQVSVCPGTRGRNVMVAGGVGAGCLWLCTCSKKGSMLSDSCVVSQPFQLIAVELQCGVLACSATALGQKEDEGAKQIPCLGLDGWLWFTTDSNQHACFCYALFWCRHWSNPRTGSLTTAPSSLE